MHIFLIYFKKCFFFSSSILIQTSCKGNTTLIVNIIYIILVNIIFHNLFKILRYLVKTIRCSKALIH